MSVHPGKAIPVAAAALLLAGCAGSGGSGQLSGPQRSTRIPAPATTSAIPPPPAGGVSNGRPTTVSGTLTRGAEPSCLILRSTTASYELQGHLAAGLRPEQRVTVRGHTVRGVASHCMQGTPFEVTAVLSP